MGGAAMQMLYCAMALGLAHLVDDPVAHLVDTQARSMNDIYGIMLIISHAVADDVPFLGPIIDAFFMKAVLMHHTAAVRL